MPFDPFSSLISAGAQLGGSLLSARQQGKSLAEQKRQFDIEQARKNYLLQFAMPGMLNNLGYRGAPPSGMPGGGGYSPFSQASNLPQQGGSGLGKTLLTGGLSQLGRIGQGRKTEDSFVRDYEDQLGKVVLPQVISMAQQGNTEGAKALLQQGVAKYQEGIQQYQQSGGNYAQTAAQSLANSGLQNTISSLSQQFGLNYAPGSGFAGTPGGGATSGDQAKASLYGLSAPLNEGDPFGLNAPKVMDAPLLNETGYDPKIQAQMRAGAMETPAASGLQEMSQMKRSLGQSGLGASPAAAALKGTVARQTGYNQTAGLRDVSLQNAQVGMENARTNVANKLGQGNLQTQYNWAAPMANFNELNARYGGAQRMLGGG